MSLLRKTITKTLFPARCLLCRLPADQSHDICSACMITLPFYTHGCLQCGAVMAIKIPSDTVCGKCLANAHAVDRTISLFDYEPPISNLLARLKFKGDLSVAPLFSQLWQDCIQKYYTKDTLPDCILPVPLHLKRLKERGFNHALEIAKPIARHLKIRCDIKTCIRIKNTAAQSSLPARKRQQNIKHAFALSCVPPFKKVAILDDVMTTGGTVHEISQLLKKSGVERIDVWCCARARLH